MAPKKKKSSKEPWLLEPEHDPSWERSVQSGLWERAVTALPDANTWPTWGALRERVLASCREIRVVDSPSVRDAFASELVRLSPPQLRHLSLRGAPNLRSLVLSPLGACPALERADLGGCPSLEYVLLQSAGLKALDLGGCGALTKALIQCPSLSKLEVEGCPNLEKAIVWSDALTELNLSGSTKLTHLELHCPALAASRAPPIPRRPAAQRPAHAPIAAALRANARDAAAAAAEAREREWRAQRGGSAIPAVHRPLAG
ncbi:MAG: hypothetical protein J3K34DRAFT_489365 [Monoraphidium minutum]|nr:MAG: hypothetical protein J3K34DRAFT_489365 [Monoraphidium minutum]